MRYFIFLCGCLFTAHSAAEGLTLPWPEFKLTANSAAENITLPWSEFKMLYHDHLSRSIQESLPKPQQEFLYTFDETGHTLTVRETDAGLSAVVRFDVSGSALNDAYQAVPLLTRDVAIAAVQHIEGGHLLSQADGYDFLPSAAGFQANLALFAPVQEDEQSLFIAYDAPTGISNKLSVELPPGYQLEQAPGLQGSDGFYYFAPGEPLQIRFRHQDSPLAQVDIDSLGEVTFQDERAVLTVHFAPAQPVKRDFNIQSPLRARYLSASLKPSAIRQNGELLTIVGGVDAPFSIQYLLQAADDGTYTIGLPVIADNAGRGGYLAVTEPDNARLQLSGAVQTLNTSQLPEALHDVVGTATHLRRLAAEEVANISLQRYTSVSTPEVVLDSLHFFVSFEESGSALGILKMQLPPSAGNRLQIARVPNAQIWSLTVNGQKKSVYSSAADSWIIPLAPGETSDVELAWLVESQPLTLQGRLDSLLPALGLPARHLHVGIALPERTELMSMEADVNPADGKEWVKPDAFIGKPYYFSRAFHTGKALPMAIFYKEPVQNLAMDQ